MHPRPLLQISNTGREPSESGNTIILKREKERARAKVSGCPKARALELKELSVSSLPVLLLIGLKMEVLNAEQGGAMKAEQDHHCLLRDRECVEL